MFQALINQSYLFCSLLLTVHFIAGFTSTATTAIEGISMFGPLAATVCAVLVSIPFRYPGSLPTTIDRSRRLSEGHVEGVQRGGSSSAPAKLRGNDGDLPARAVTGILGVSV